LVFLLAFLLVGARPVAAGGRNEAELKPKRGQLRYAPDEVLVRFRATAAPPAMAAAHQRVGGQVLRSYRTLPGLQAVKLPAGMKVQRALRAYRQSPDVLYAEPNWRVQIQATPNDPSFGELWGLNNTGQSGGTVDADIDAPEAWNLTTGSSSVVVAVIDTGIDYNHPDLAANVIQLESNCSDGVDNDGNGFIDDCRGIDTANDDTDPFDDNAHGTHVSGTIGAVGNNAVGVAGVNWTVKLMACKFLFAEGFGFTDDAVACLDYLALMKDRGVPIVASSNSWGGGGFSQALQDAIDQQRQRGILFIAAAGNAASDNDSGNFFPANYPLPNILSVAATTRTDALAGFSNFGRRRVHLGAPGEQVLSTTPGNTYSTFSGTSMATPHVSGVAALLQAQNPGRDWRAIKNLILAGGDTIAATANTITGKRLNAFGALTCANAVVLSRLEPIRAAVAGTIGEPIRLSALHINCDLPNGNVQVSVNGGQSTVTLLDDGAGADRAAGDGIYTGEFTPAEGGFIPLDFPDGSTVTVLIPSADPYLLLDFESESRFSAQQFGQTFTWQTTTNRGQDEGHSPVTSFYFGDPDNFTFSCGQDEFGNECTEAGLLISPPIGLGPGPHLLAFNYFLQTEDLCPFDFAGVFIATNDGQTFSLLLDNCDNGLVDNTGEWQTAVADLSAFAGQTVQVAFYFDTLDNLFNFFEGWYVDDLVIDGQNLGLTIQGASVVEGESGTTPVDFVFRLARGASGNQDTIVLNWTTQDGTATVADNDYQPASGSLEFQPGESEKTVTVLVNGDATREPTETFSVGFTTEAFVLCPFGCFGTGTIVFDEPNQLPVVDAGPDQTGDRNTSGGRAFTLSGSATDGDGDPLTFTWKLLGQTVGTGQTPTATFPPGVNSVTLEVSDGFEVATDTVTVTVTDFSLAANPPSLTINAGQTATITITGTPLFGPFNTPITFACGPLPANTRCNFSPGNTLTLGANPASLTLTIQTNVSSAAAAPSPFQEKSSLPVYALWLVAPGLLGLAAAGRRRRGRALVALGLLLALTAGAAACGGGGGSGGSGFTGPPFRTPPGNYVIEVNATAGSFSTPVVISLTVQ
jgi:subtilisin family serine protease